MNCLPRNENVSLYQAALMISIDSSKISRLTRSCSADIALSPLATTRAERLRLTRHGAATDAELHPVAGEDLHQREVLGEAQRVPLRHDVEHLTEAQPFGLLGEVQAEQDQVRE